MTIHNNSAQFLKRFHLSAAPGQLKNVGHLALDLKAQETRSCLCVSVNDWVHLHEALPAPAPQTLNVDSSKVLIFYQNNSKHMKTPNDQNPSSITTEQMQYMSLSVRHLKPTRRSWPPHTAMSKAKMLHYLDLPATSTWDFPKTKTLSKAKRHANHAKVQASLRPTDGGNHSCGPYTLYLLMRVCLYAASDQ